MERVAVGGEWQYRACGMKECQVVRLPDRVFVPLLDTFTVIIKEEAPDVGGDGVSFDSTIRDLAKKLVVSELFLGDGLLENQHECWDCPVNLRCELHVAAH